MKKIFFKKGIILFWVIALVWVAFVVNYLRISGWWENRGMLSPMEVVGGISGLFSPLILLFLVWF